MNARRLISALVLLLTFLVGGLHARGLHAQSWLPWAKPAPPQLRAVRCGPFIYATETPFGTAVETSRDLLALNSRLGRELGVQLPAGARVRIYILDTPGSFARYVQTHVPYLNNHDVQRNAIFILRNGVPHIFALRCETLAASLRHEFVHVILNQPSAKPLPVWLDEGLAQYYQGNRPDGWAEKPARLMEMQRQRNVLPDLKKLQQCAVMADMGPAQYAEAWWWTHQWMSNRDRQRIFVTHLHNRLSGKPSQLPASVP